MSAGEGVIIVIGGGVTGRAVERWFSARGEDVTVVDDAEPTPADAVDTPAGLAALDQARLVVPSPGVPPSHAIVTAARDRGVPLASEIDLAAAETPATLIAVTGTNGKTTVTSLIAEMLRASGVAARTAGNIGPALLEVVGEEAGSPGEMIVVEVSSFQLATSRSFRPRIAVLLNVSDDHLDWHGSFEAYVRAKARVFARQSGDDVLLYNADDPVVATMAESAPARRQAFSTVAGVDQVLAEVTPDSLVDRSNVAAAAAAARAAGASERGIREGLEHFPGLPHRVALVGEAGGVRWVDDSKATNPGATNHAIARFERVVLIAGGRNKGLDLSALARRRDRVRGVVAIGESAQEVVTAFGDVAVPVRRAASMRAAVAEAATLARPGDTVLLSPACSSYDWYRSYAERGDDFVAEVGALLDASREARR